MKVADDCGYHPRCELGESTRRGSEAKLLLFAANDMIKNMVNPPTGGVVEA
jgi:hypothetical protein